MSTQARMKTRGNSQPFENYLVKQVVTMCSEMFNGKEIPETSKKLKATKITSKIISPLYNWMIEQRDIDDVMFFRDIETAFNNFRTEYDGGDRKINYFEDQKARRKIMGVVEMVESGSMINPAEFLLHQGTYG